jgi:PAS domain S-box-containing protein
MQVQLAEASGRKVKTAVREKVRASLAEAPLRFLLTLVAIVFVSEAVLTIVMPLLEPAGMSETVEAFSDAFSLTLIISPAVWLLLIRPLRSSARLLSGLNHQLRQEIAERDRAEEALGRSRTVLAHILDSVPQSIFWKDRESRYLGCNAVFAKAAGLDSPQAIVGKTDFDLPWPRQDTEAYRADDAEVMRNNRGKRHIVEPLQQADGSRLWIDTSKVPLADRRGTVYGVLGIYDDMTERRRAELALQESEQKYRALLDATDTGYVIVDAEGRVLDANAEYARLTGHETPQQILGRKVTEWTAEHDRARNAAEVRKCAERGGVRNLQIDYVNPQGGCTPIEINAAVLQSGAGNRIVTLCRDITERMHLDCQLRQAHKLEAIGQLAAGIAHEINTPTQYVSDNVTFLKESWSGVSQLLDLARTLHEESLTGRSSPETIRRVSQCVQGADLDFLLQEIPRAVDQALLGLQRVANIVRCMKEFSHPDLSGKEAVDINRAIETTITVARHEWKYVADVITEFDSALPPVPCFLGEFTQVILNLIVNSAHAIKDAVGEGNGTKGKITVSTYLKGDVIEIRVSDTGAGIPEEIRSRIFEPFFTTKEVGKGSGQGLALAHTVIVKKHGGKVWFESEPGKGTTFFLQLPLAGVPAAKA